MLDTASSWISAPARLAAAFGGLLCLTACEPNEKATDGDATSAATEPTSTGGTGDPNEPTSTGGTGDPTEPTGTGGTETAGACEGHDIVDDCCCFSLTPGDGGPTPPTIELGCGDSPLCASFVVFCGDPEDNMSSEPCTAVSDEAALDCALAALAASQPGSLHFELEHPSGFGFWGDSVAYYLRGDATAFVAERESSDSASSAAVSLRPLQPVAFFTDCQAASVEAKIECLRTATTDPVTEQCVEQGP